MGPQRVAVLDQLRPSGERRCDCDGECIAPASRRDGGRAVPVTQRVRIAHDKRETGGQCLVAGALHRVVTIGESQHEVGTTQQRPVRRKVEVTSQGHVGRQVVDRSAGVPGEHYFDARQQTGSGEDVVDGLVGVPAAREDSSQWKLRATTAIGLGVGHIDWRVVEDGYSAVGEPGRQLSARDEDEIGVPREHGESATRTARPRADDGCRMRVDHDRPRPAKTPSQRKSYERERRRHHDQCVGPATPQHSDGLCKLHGIAPEHREPLPKPTDADELRARAHAASEIRAATVVADPRERQNRGARRHSRTTVPPLGAALRVSKTTSLTAATASRSIAR
jgi:hypothetical protein